MSHNSPYFKEGPVCVDVDERAQNAAHNSDRVPHLRAQVDQNPTRVLLRRQTRAHGKGPTHHFPHTAATGQNIIRFIGVKLSIRIL